jgi:activator of HSP90 ATPase
MKNYHFLAEGCKAWAEPYVERKGKGVVLLLQQLLLH